MENADRRRMDGAHGDMHLVLDNAEWSQWTSGYWQRQQYLPSCRRRPGRYQSPQCRFRRLLLVFIPKYGQPVLRQVRLVQFLVCRLRLQPLLRAVCPSRLRIIAANQSSMTFTFIGGDPFSLYHPLAISQVIFAFRYDHLLLPYP